MTSPQALQDLTGLCKQTLKSNIVPTQAGHGLCAGGHQFRSLWTRDFCFSMKGLLLAGHQEVAKEHLTLILKHVTEAGYVPRLLDVGYSGYQVVKSTLLRKLPLPNWRLDKSFKAEYYGEHATLSFDSGLLVILALLEYEAYTGHTNLLIRFQDKVNFILDFYFRKLEGNLIFQPNYSDWQDSAKRKGRTSFVNLLLAEVLDRFENSDNEQIRQLDIPTLELFARANIDSKLIMKEIHQFFWKDGLLRSQEKGEQVSFDSNALAFTFGVAETLGVDYQRLKSSKLWLSGGLPGRSTAPNYHPKQISLTTKTVGLRHYHDELIWSPLIGMAAQVAVLNGDLDEAGKILVAYQRIATENQAIHEIYDLDLNPFETAFYQSEHPFSWGAAEMLKAVDAYRKAVNQSNLKPST